jgi:hypothetical protein
MKRPQISEVLNAGSIGIDTNQEDIEEKKQQIPLMGDIYARAGRVLIWLGEDADGSSKGIAPKAAEERK